MAISDAPKYFTDALQHLDQKKDRVMCDLLAGLLEMAEELARTQSALRQLQAGQQQALQELHWLKQHTR